MLVLSRKIGERIHIGDDIVLEVRRISGNRVTLALEAPRDVRILRGELERAAKEFESLGHGSHDQMDVPSDAVTEARLRIIEHLATQAVSSDFVV